jgi:hypothetical protein
MSRGRDLDKRLPVPSRDREGDSLHVCILVFTAWQGTAGRSTSAYNHGSRARIFRQGRISFHVLFRWCCAPLLIRISLDREGRVRSSFIEVFISRRRVTELGSDGEGGRETSRPVTICESEMTVQSC